MRSVAKATDLIRNRLRCERSSPWAEHHSAPAENSLPSVHWSCRRGNKPRFSPSDSNLRISAPEG